MLINELNVQNFVAKLQPQLELQYKVFGKLFIRTTFIRSISHAIFISFRRKYESNTLLLERQLTKRKTWD